MADFVFNIAKGRGVEYYNRVEASDPTDAVFVIILTKASDTDAVHKDYDDLSLLIADAQVDEADFASYARIVLSQTELAALPAPDDTNDRYEVDLPDQTWSAATTGQGLFDMIVCYDSDSTGGTDANIIPLSQHDFVATTDGNDLVAVFDALGFLRAA